MRSFKEWTLAELDRTFSLAVADDSHILKSWLAGQAKISAFEQEALDSSRSLLAANVYDWNETELAYNFIGPVMALVRFSTKHSIFSLNVL